jgi:hypothetical protein
MVCGGKTCAELCIAHVINETGKYAVSELKKKDRNII